MYLAVLLVIAFAILGTKAQLCGQNVTLNRHLSLTWDANLWFHTTVEVCRIFVQPSNNSMLMAAMMSTTLPLHSDKDMEEICNILKVIHRENTYNLCHPESLPTLDDEFVIEVQYKVQYKEEWLSKGYSVSLDMTVFYQAQCHIDAEMCAARDDDPRFYICGRAERANLDNLDKSRRKYPLCTDQMAMDCPHECDVCSNGTAGACCFNGWYQRGTLADESALLYGRYGPYERGSMVTCNSRPYGCNEYACDNSCDVGKANGPYCVVMTGYIVVHDGGGGGNSRLLGARSNDDGGDGDSVDGGGGVTKSGNMAKSGGNGVCMNWAAITGIIIPLIA